MYYSKDLAVIIPTRDRPEHIQRLLISLVDQVEQVSHIIIIASGNDIKSTIEKFSDKLSIEYHHTSRTGQIRQRNIGISKLDDKARLVACLDDDIIVDKDAIKNLIQFWNTSPDNTAGIGFNEINKHDNNTSIIRQLLYLGHSKPGKVLRSGTATLISNLKENISSQWLNGGMTVWKKKILMENKHKEINTKWAIAEDLIFSYPIGKEFPLFVCADAKVNHNHNPYNTDNNKWHYSYGRTQTIWIYHFVFSNKELSKILFFYTIFIRLIMKFIYGLITRRSDLLNFSFGVISAIGETVQWTLGLSKKVDIREE